MRRLLFFTLGVISLVLGAAGAFLPLLPTMPFMLLAAFCFARSSPKIENWLVRNKSFGPHIIAWRESRSVSRSGKRAAWIAFALSGALGLILLPWPWSAVPIVAAFAGSWWMASLPTAPAAPPTVRGPD